MDTVPRDLDTTTPSGWLNFVVQNKFMQQRKVWFITGASSGFGLTLASQLLAAGHKVAATSRDKKNIEDRLGAGNPDLLALTVTLTDEASVKAALEQTIDTFGHIDVAVNNAGYMLLGSLEEVSAAEFRQSMDLNVFAFLHVIRNVMPHFRQRQAGHIFNFASSAGYGGDGAAGSYNTVKAAVIGLSEALALEVAPFNVKVTIVSPGLFRTNFLGSGSFAIAKHEVAGYATRQLREAMEQFNGKQPSDPAKLAAAIVGVAELEAAPLHLVMGVDAYQRATGYYTRQLQDIQGREALSRSMGFDEANG